MKKIFEHKVSKIAGNIIMIMTLIAAALGPCICESITDIYEWYGIAIALVACVITLDIAICDKKAVLEKKPDQYVKGTVNLNW